MKKHKALIAEDSQAMKKLDTQIQEDDPFAKEPGGSAYVAKETGIGRIEQMYSSGMQEYNKKVSHGNLVATVTVIIVGIALVALLIFLIKA